MLSLRIDAERLRLQVLADLERWDELLVCCAQVVAWRGPS
jgi:hypothetical protein